MNIKKLVSAASALAIAAGAFAGMAVTASAATPVYSDNYTSGSAASTWSGNAQKAVAADGATTNGKGGSSYYIMGASNGRQRPAWTDIAAEAVSGVIRVNLNIRFDSSYNSTSSTATFKLLSKTPTDANNDTTGASILEIAAGTSDSGYTQSYTVNGTAIDCLDVNDAKQSNAARDTSGWLNLDAVINTTTKKLDLKLSRITNNKDADTYTVAETPVYSVTNLDFMNDVSAFKSIMVFSARYPSYNGGQVWLDDINVQTLTAPALTLSEKEKTVSIGSSVDVAVTDITGDISVSVDNDSIATASYADGTVTITGVSEGVAKVTVTATNDGLTASEEIAATVGDVQTSDVTVNYLKTGTETAVKTADKVTKAVGASVTADDVNTETFITENARYTYNAAASTVLPYTVTGTNDVINIYYDEAAKVSEVAVKYAAGETVVKTMNETPASDLYVGDEYSTFAAKYFVVDGVLYETGLSDTYVTQELAQDGSITIPVTAKEETAVQYAEAEDVIKGTNFGFNGKSSKLSLGYAVRSIDGKAYEVLTVNETGIYNITMPTFTNNVSSGKGYLYVYKNSTDNLIATKSGQGSINGIDKSTTSAVLQAGDKILVQASNTQVGFDYILIEKTGNAPEALAPEAVAVDSNVNNDGVYAKAFKFTAKANDGSFSKVTIAVEGSNEGSKEIPVEVITGGNAVFGIIFATDNAEATLPGAEAISIVLE